MNKSGTVYADYVYRDSESGCAHSYVLPLIQKVIKGIPPGANIVDLGCGNGSLTAAWATSRWKVYGVDLSESGIRSATQAYPQITFCVGDVTGDLDEQLGKQVFDVVITTEVIEHLYAPRKLVSNAFRLLKNGGSFIVSTPYHGYWKNLALAVTGKMDAHHTALWDGGHIKFWSVRTMTHLLMEAGFQQIEFYGAGRVPFLWKSMIMKAIRPTS